MSNDMLRAQIAEALRGKPRSGAIAVCGAGTLGLITEDAPCNVMYPDGNSGLAYVGIHLEDKIAPIGSPWSSRRPQVVAYLKSFNSMPERIEAALLAAAFSGFNDGYMAHIERGRELDAVACVRAALPALRGEKPRTNTIDEQR